MGSMQLPGPTLIVNQGDIVTVTLHNSLPAAAGNTSILFPGFNVCVGNLTGATATASGTCTVNATNPGVAGILTRPGAVALYAIRHAPVLRPGRPGCRIPARPFVDPTFLTSGHSEQIIRACRAAAALF